MKTVSIKTNFNPLREPVMVAGEENLDERTLQL
jgi:hypothetical protein